MSYIGPQRLTKQQGGLFSTAPSKTSQNVCSNTPTVPAKPTCLKLHTGIYRYVVCAGCFHRAQSNHVHVISISLLLVTEPTELPSDKAARLRYHDPTGGVLIPNNKQLTVSPVWHTSSFNSSMILQYSY